LRNFSKLVTAKIKSIDKYILPIVVKN